MRPTHPLDAPAGVRLPGVNVRGWTVADVEEAARATDLPVRMMLEEAFRADVQAHLLKSLTGG